MRHKRSRRPEWLVVLGALAIFATWYAFEYLVPGDRPLAGNGRPGTDWFLVVRVPEVPKDDTGIAAHRARLTSWLEACRAAGFRPMLLSEAVERLRLGHALPEKALVFAFTHSYRPTVEALRPIFEEQQVPAVWLANEQGLAESDQRFVSPHEWGLMRRSRRWDLGIYGGGGTSSRTFVLDGEGARPLTWLEDAGRWGLNRGRDLPSLRFLSAQRSWTARQLVDRLQSEVPLRDPTPLTAVQMFQWQLGVPAYSPETPREFALSAPTWRRSGAVTWLGASETADAALRLEAAEVIGELWVGLRMQPDGSGVKVGFTEDRWVVDVTVDGRDRRLTAVPWPRRKKRAVSAVVVWRGDRVVVRTAGGSRAIRVPPAKRWRGPLELVVYHKIRGVALARGLKADLVPIAPPAPLAPPGTVTSVP
jgi:hypothetical protein